MSRFKAAAVHFAVSAVVAALVLAVLWLAWYPGALFEATGGRRLLMLIVLIDIVAGPLLTLVVYDAKKPEIRRDMTIIVLAQVAFLAYGCYVAMTARPAFIVFAQDRFSVVPSNAISDADLAEAPDAALRVRSWSGPRLVFAEPPTDDRERQALMASAVEGRDIETFPRYYRAYEANTTAVILAARPLEQLAAINDRARAEVEQFLATREDDADLGFVPMVARFQTVSAIVSRKDGSLVATLPVDPWGEAP